jgi:hypothetical protein
MKHRKTTPIPTRPTDRGLSALGQKPTFAVQNGMSALHLKADMCGAMRDVRFVPKADMTGLSTLELGDVWRGRIWILPDGF